MNGLPEGFAVRTATAGDVDDITAVIAAVELDVNGEVDVDTEDVAVDLTAPLLAEPAHAVVVVEGSTDRIVAVSILHANHGGVWAAVHPDRRERGIGSALLTWTERTARVAGVRSLRQVHPDAHDAARELLAAFGYAPAWTSWLLEYRMGDDAPAPDEPPEGIAIRPFDPADERVVHCLIQDAFGEWEQHDAQTFEQWRTFTVARGVFDARLSPVAVDGASDEIVGVALCLAYDEDEGYVHQLAVRRDHRNRGIARALLLTAFSGFHDLGRRVVTLGTDSRTGALPMYERVGMRVRRSYTTFRKELLDDQDAAEPASQTAS